MTWVVISFILLKLFPLLGEHIPWRLQAALGLQYASLFFAGIVFYKIWSQGATPTRIVLVTLCYFEHIFNQSLIWVGIMTAVFGVFALCVINRGVWLTSRPLIFLGTISYSLYLLHGTLGYRLQLLNYNIGLSPLTNLAVATAVTICAAAAVTFLVERPANRAIRALYRRTAFSGQRLAQARTI
jgi:peptidoglycan/LPS O-acetylase OafA/YrhL